MIVQWVVPWDCLRPQAKFVKDFTGSTGAVTLKNGAVGVTFVLLLRAQE